MELNISIYKAPLISNYAALFELWGSIKLTHQSSFPIDWGKFSEAGFSADVITERDCEIV